MYVPSDATQQQQCNLDDPSVLGRVERWESACYYYDYCCTIGLSQIVELLLFRTRSRVKCWVVVGMLARSNCVGREYAEWDPRRAVCALSRFVWAFAVLGAAWFGCKGNAWYGSQMRQKGEWMMDDGEDHRLEIPRMRKKDRLAVVRDVS